MCDTSLTRQALPDERYLYLLGVAVSVFCSNMHSSLRILLEPMLHIRGIS